MATKKKVTSNSAAIYLGFNSYDDGFDDYEVGYTLGDVKSYEYIVKIEFPKRTSNSKTLTVKFSN